VPIAVLAFFALEAILAWGLWKCLAQGDFVFTPRLGLADRPRRPTLYWSRAVALIILMVGLARAAWVVFISHGGIVFACAQDLRLCP
jgi:hypothetical protein